MDWLSLLATLKQYSGAGVSLVGLLVITSQYWTPYLKNLKFPGFSKPPEGDVDPSADVADVEALHLLRARAKRSHCPQLKAAVREVEKCFFNRVELSYLDKLDATVNAIARAEAEKVKRQAEGTA